jgi:tetratricopeptide (TPR) repeat protein
MKMKVRFYRLFVIGSLGFFITYGVAFYSPCSAQSLDPNVKEAYLLRLDGKADSAKVLLESILVEDSTNAAAWYELARTKHHIGLAHPAQLFGGLIQDIQKHIDRAVETDPQNVIYSYYKAIIDHTILYMNLNMGKEDVSRSFTKTIDSYQNLLTMKPDYYEAKLAMVELYALLPENMGGDKALAKKYTHELEKSDVVFGAKARELIMPDNSDYILFWQHVKENNAANADIYEALGKAYLRKDQPDMAVSWFEQAISLNPDYHILYVDLGNYYLMQAMQNIKSLSSVSAQIEYALTSYINSKPEPIIPLKAYVIGKMSMIKLRTGNAKRGTELQSKAMALDPNFSKAFGIPSQILFDPPDKISHAFTYFFRPY